MNQLFQFDGTLYETDRRRGNGLCSPLGPLMANAFLCSVEEKLDQYNKIPEFYRRYVDNTFATMKMYQQQISYRRLIAVIHP